MIRRRIALAYWVIAIAFFIPKVAYAYIDPATTTYLVQIATALVVTIGVSLSIFLYRFRLITSRIKYWFSGLIYRSRVKGGKGRGTEAPDKKKEPAPYVAPAFALPGAAASPELESFGEDVRGALSESRAAAAPGKKGGGDATPHTYAGKMRRMIPLALAVSFIFIVIGCLELAIQFSPEIPFSIAAVAPVVILLFAVVFALFIFVIPCFKGRVYEILLTVGLSVLVAGYFQGNFLNWGLGQLTGDAVIWSNLMPQIVVSTIVWIGCFILMLLLLLRARKVWSRLIVFVPLLLILLQGAGFVSVLYNNTDLNLLNDRGRWSSEGDFWKTADEALTVDRINEVASGNNAIIIILDRLDQDLVAELAADDPHFFDPLDGFTEFDDYISYYGSTFPSVPAFLTGDKYMYDMPISDYFDYAWANSRFLNTLKERGVDIRLYIDRGSVYSNISQLSGIVSNTFVGDVGINKRIALVKLLKLAGYRYAPMPMKQFFWFAPNEFIDTLELTDQTSPYLIDDFKYYANLVKDGLSVSQSDQKAFIYIHLQGPHPPFHMDENIQYVDQSTSLAQAKGSFKIVYEYLRQLKALGKFDDSTIVIMGDHGNYLGDNLTKPALTGLLVKPAGGADVPLQISHAPVCPDELHATLMQGLFGSSEDFGKTFFDMKEGDDVTREYVINLSRYEIKGDGRDFANWSFIGRFQSN